MAAPTNNLKSVFELGSRESLDPSLCGAKAANLARLKRAGFPVPPGFVITAGALDERTPSAADIEHAYRKLSPDNTKVAVRSSSTAEDLPGLSFAGQYESYLNIETLEDLLGAIAACRQSLSSERAQVYLAKSGIKSISVKMAVLVQRMVPADLSGVIFTANPLNGYKCQMLVNLSRGTGEALASGKAEPVQLVLEKSTGAVISGRTDTLVPGMISELVRKALKIEELFGQPQDIEFSFDRGRLHILQSRPITALPEPQLPYPIIWGKETSRRILDEATIYWSNWNTRENMPYPLKPLSWSFLNDLLFPAIFRVLFGTRPDSPLYEHCFLVDLVNGRAYWNMNLLFGHPFFGFLLRPLLKHLDREAGETFECLLQSGRLAPHKPRISGLGLFREWTVAVKTWMGFPWFSSIASIEANCLAYWKRADLYNSFPMDGLSNLDLLKRAREFGYQTARAAFPMLMVAGKALWGMSLIEWLTHRWKDLNLDHLLAGIPSNKTTEGALELFRLSEMPTEVRKTFESWPGGDFRALEENLGQSVQGREYLDRIAGFLDKHGHRGLKDLDFGYPSWGEDRTFIYQVIKDYLDYGPGDKTPLDHYEEAKGRRIELTEEIERRLRNTFAGWLKARIFRFGLKQAQDHFPLRENEKYYGLRCFPGSRRIVQEIGRRYQEDGLLKDKDDIFFLTVPEIEQMEKTGAPDGAVVQRLIEARKSQWREQVDARPPSLVRSDGVVETETAGDKPEPGVLHGVPASPGTAKGIARVLREPSEALRLRKGEILVAPYTEPGWAPLFLLAKALVMEVGGAVCHGAIVAREYGIPAVVGAKGATVSIRDGQEITVDGNRGEVRFNPGDSVKVLRGEKVLLRRPLPEDLEYIRALWADPDTMEAVGGPVLRSLEQMDDWYRRMVEPGSPHDRYFLICDRGGTPVGEASFHRYDPKAKIAELNIKIEARHRYRGHGPESLSLLLDYFFGEFGGEVMLDSVRLENRNGRRALLTAGFQEDRSRADICLLRMTRDRYLRLRKAGG